MNGCSLQGEGLGGGYSCGATKYYMTSQSINSPHVLNFCLQTLSRIIQDHSGLIKFQFILNLI